jgi:hypothetical protein
MKRSKRDGKIGNEHCSPYTVRRSFPPSCFPPFLSVAKRQFKTDDDVTWIVWDVHPEDLGRLAYDRRAASPAAEGSTRAEGSRRSERLVHPELQHGWLCFQSGTDKRRLTPIPEAWHELPDAVLCELLDAAIPAPQPDGRVSRPSASD